MDKLYLVGEIVNTFGIKGEVKVKSDTTFDRFKKGNKLYILMNGKYLPITICSHRVHQGMDLITFNDLYDINLVEQYKGLKIYTEHNDKLEDGHIYYEDLIGKDVLVDAKKIGYVKDIMELPKGILLEVDVNGTIKLIPYVNEFIGEITDKTITIYPIEGLL